MNFAMTEDAGPVHSATTACNAGVGDILSLPMRSEPCNACGPPPSRWARGGPRRAPPLSERPLVPAVPWFVPVAGVAGFLLYLLEIAYLIYLRGGPPPGATIRVGPGLLGVHNPPRVRGRDHRRVRVQRRLEHLLRIALAPDGHDGQRRGGHGGHDDGRPMVGSVDCRPAATRLRAGAWGVRSPQKTASRSGDGASGEPHFRLAP